MRRGSMESLHKGLLTKKEHTALEDQPGRGVSRYMRCECCANKREHDYLREQRESREKRLAALKAGNKTDRGKEESEQDVFQRIPFEELALENIRVCSSEEKKVSECQEYNTLERISLISPKKRIFGLSTPESSEKPERKQLSSIPEVQHSQSLAASTNQPLPPQFSLSLSIAIDDEIHSQEWSGQQNILDILQKLSELLS